MKKSISSLLLLVSLASGDFIRDDSKSIVLDTSTNLIWQDDNRTTGDENRKTWENAISFCESLDFAGYNDWHLPNYNELHSLVNRRIYNPPKISEVFQNKVSNNYWSSTTYASDTSKAWSVYFRYGNGTYRDKTDTDYVYVRCVRLADN